MSALERRTVTLTASEWERLLDEMVMAEVARPHIREDSAAIRRKIAVQLAGQVIGE